MEVVNTVSDGDCLLDAFITSAFANKKIAPGALPLPLPLHEWFPLLKLPFPSQGHCGEFHGRQSGNASPKKTRFAFVAKWV